MHIIESLEHLENYNLLSIAWKISLLDSMFFQKCMQGHFVVVHHKVQVLFLKISVDLLHIYECSNSLSFL